MNTSSTDLDHARWPALLDGIRGLTVWVVGDVMLDEYALGKVERISPEAPVPVLHVERMDERLGGAANVARQAAMLGACVRLAGVVGNDAAGRRLQDLCRQASIDTRALHRLAARSTTRKLRALARHQQLVRLDYEDADFCPGEAVRSILGHLRASPVPDAIILSDYAKGVLAPDLMQGIRELTASSGAVIVADPKRRDLGFYRGATVITPNLRELEAAVRRSFDPDDTAAIAASARTLAGDVGAQALVVTLAKRGMLVVPAQGLPHSIAASGRSLFDPTGAGDTVIAVLATLLGAGACLVEAAHAANAAAGIAVSRVGAASITRDEIVDALGDAGPRKLLGGNELAAQVDRWRRAGKRVVFTNGCFDLLHAGHLALLKEASRHGDVLIVAINSDASVRRLKGAQRPFIHGRERAAMLAAFDCVDAVTVFDGDTPINVITSVQPDVLVKGQDYRVDQVAGYDIVKANGGRVVLVPLVPEHSTTALVERIRCGSRVSTCPNRT